MVKNVCKLQKAPKVPESEMVIVQDVPGFVALLRAVAGRRLYAPAIVALFTGMRLGEVLALREGRVDLDKGVLEVREALEETKTYGVRFKTAKTKAGRRNVTLPTIAVEALRDHRKHLLETRLLLGRHRSIATLRLNTATTLFFLQHLDRTSHNLPLIPVNTFEGTRNPTLCVKDVNLDAVPVHQRFDEVDSKLEVSAKDVVVLNHP